MVTFFLPDLLKKLKDIPPNFPPEERVVKGYQEGLGGVLKGFIILYNKAKEWVMT